MAQILVVDDLPNNRYFLRQLLKSQGHETIEAANGNEALDKAAHHTPDLVISDILMPEMDGFVLCRQWKSNTRLNTIPFVFYTAAYGRSEDETFARSLGADAFIMKPLSNERLLAEISGLLQSDRLQNTDDQTYEALTQEEYLENYNERLASKLQQQVHELDKKNHMLQERELQLKQAQSQLENKVLLRTRELEQANKELVSFCHSLPHDLRGPNRSISGFASIILEDANDRLLDEDKAYLQRIQASSGRIEALIQAMMKLYQINEARMIVETVDLSQLAGIACDELCATEPERNVHCIIQKGVYAEGDRQMLALVLENLIGNAWKYTRNTDNAEIEFGITHVEGQPCCFIRDNGAGFDMQYAGKLFVAFERLHSASEFEGNGIGLATVERVIKCHHGTIWANSRPNMGATFFFSIAMADQPETGEFSKLSHS